MTCNPINPLLQEPFYTHPCSEVTEDHARHLIVHQYVACLKIVNEWAVPLNSVAVWVELPAVVDILTDCCLWNPQFGYFIVSAFDKQAQRVQVQRKDVIGTAAPGVRIPSCTKFIVTPNI